MPFTLTMPKLSPTMEEGTIAKWHKKVGDHVEADELLFEVATDKATVEYNAIDSGWLRQILVPEGKGTQVNQPVAIFSEEQNESLEGYQPEGIKQEAPKEATSKLPSEKKEPPSLSKPVPTITPSLKPNSFVPEPPLEKPMTPLSREEGQGRILASPLARKIAKENGLDLGGIKGTGPNQRIMSRDLAQAQPKAAIPFSRHELPQIAPGSFVEEQLSPMRKVIAQRLQEAKTYIPHFYLQQIIDAEPIVALREQLSRLEMKVSVNDLIIKASALALRQHPDVNSGFNASNFTVIRFQTVDISIAVSIEGGLITPIIRYADYKHVMEISKEMRQLAQKAKEGKLQPQEYKGGSFTISNLGMYGMTNFQAIINPPQAAILAVSGICNTPVVKKEAVVPGKTLSLTLSVDHRVIDGVAGAEFLKTVQKYLENPAILVM